MVHYTKMFLLKSPLFMFLANFIFTFKNTLNCSLKSFESSDVILVKNKILKVYWLSLFLCSNLC